MPTAQPLSSWDAPTSLAGFAHLPNEISWRIIDLACQATPSSEEDGAASASDFQSLDVATLLSLTLTSRQLYPALSARLYTHVKISTVSALRSFQYAVSSRPALGRCVRSLHLGPENNMASEWSPLRLANDKQQALHFATSLDRRDMRGLPNWCKPLQQWPLRELSFFQRCSHRAVRQAIQSALESVNVSPREPHCDHTREEIGRDTWTVRIYLVQAALDIYLKTLRGLDDTLDEPHPLRCSSRADTCKFYPTLAVTMTPTQAVHGHAQSQPSRQEGVLEVTEGQLLAHLARRGSLTDRFDHPLLFARSGVLIYNIGPGWKSKDVFAAPGDEDSFMHDGRLVLPRAAVSGDPADLYSTRDGQMLLGPIDSFAAPADTPDALDPALSTTATIGSMLTLARSVLASTPELMNLSLTSFFERAFCGSRAAPELRALRFLSLGPSPPHWHLGLDFDAAKLRKVERLRLCGTKVDEEQAASITRAEGSLPSLQELQFTMASSQSVVNLADALTSLHGKPKRRAKKSSQQAEGVFIPNGSPSTLFIDVRISSREQYLLPRLTRGQSISQALRDKMVLAYGLCHRLFVDVEVALGDVGGRGPETVPQIVHQEAREWWEECARKCQ